MSNKIKIVSISKNSQLIKSLDKIATLYNYHELEKFKIETQKINAHFIIIDIEEISKYFENSKMINNFIYTIKDHSLNNSNIVIVSKIENISDFIHNNTIDDFIITPFSENVLLAKINLIYNKNAFEDTLTSFMFNEEIQILNDEISLCLNRLQTYYYSACEKSDKIIKLSNEIPAGFVLNLKKTQLLIDIMNIYNSKSVSTHKFKQIIVNIKEILNLYDIKYELTIDKSFLFSELNFIQSKYYSLTIIFSILNIIISDKQTNILISKKLKYLEVNFSNDINIDKPLFSNLLLKKLFEQHSNIKLINNKTIQILL